MQAHMACRSGVHIQSDENLGPTVISYASRSLSDMTWSVDISKQKVRTSLLFGDVNASTCIFMVYHL